MLVAAILAVVSSSREASARVEATALAGQPFGVATVTLPARVGAALDPRQLTISDAERRLHYPVVTSGGFRRVLGQLLGADNPPAQTVTVLFLFRGDRPLTLTLNTPTPTEIVVAPQRRPGRAHARMLNEWWREYNAHARRQKQAGDYPTFVHDYLIGMLGQRLELAPPLLTRVTNPTAASTETRRTLELLAGTEKIRADALRRTMQSGILRREAATLPPPRDVAWTPWTWNDQPAGIDIEPIAMHVPQECFYVRFGSFSNYLWLDHLTDEYGGDISRMVAKRGIETSHGGPEEQMALKQTTLGDLLGEQVIADVAIIGMDAYEQEGAAAGILFQARNQLLGRDLRGQLTDALNKNKERHATLEKIDVGGREVLFLSTPDNRLRSFYAVDGDFHLVTTCRRIVERFFETGAGRGALGASDEFRFARAHMPTARGDTVFVYFSRAFFQGLVSPQYQVELARRLEASTDLTLIKLAQLAAGGEGFPGVSTDQLIAGGFLPVGFGRRPDGSGPILTDETVIDSLRGPQGSFLPIPDTPLKAVTPTEAHQYAAKAEYYMRNWKQLDPIAAGIKRYALDNKGKERIVIDAVIAPFEETKYGWVASVLGPATQERIQTAPDDIISVQAHVQGGLLDASIPPHHMFLGVRDTLPATDLRPDGLLKMLQILRTTPGYLGGWPKPGYLDWLPLGLGGSDPDPFGYSQLLFGLWRRQFDAFSVLSFDRGLLEYVSPHLRPVVDPVPAQLRVRVGDLSQAQLRHWLNAMNYERSRQTTIGNLDSMQHIHRQLAVPLEESQATLEDLFDASLVCTLGGDYKLMRNDRGDRWWTSSKLTDQLDVPPDYQSPVLQWFRGANAHLRKTPAGVVVHAQIDMQRNSKTPRFVLPPVLNMFNGDKKPAGVKLPGEKPAKRGQEFE
jgi:hypothetical protein